MDSYDIIMNYVKGICKDTRRTQMDKVLMDVCAFYSMASNSGRIYPHYKFAISIIEGFKAFGLHGTVDVLNSIGKVIVKCNGNIENAENIIEANLQQYEGMAEGDFEWAEKVLHYIINNESQFMWAIYNNAYKANVHRDSDCK